VVTPVFVFVSAIEAFIVTAFNDDYWNPHGISWIASLCEFSKTSATPVVLNLGLNVMSIILKI
jgi:hypothetical protein